MSRILLVARRTGATVTAVERGRKRVSDIVDKPDSVITTAAGGPTGADLASLLELAEIPGPSGREQEVADYVEGACRRIPGVSLRRTGDILFAAKGTPRTALVAHMDTVGFTLGYGDMLIPIGAPEVSGGESLRLASGEREERASVRMRSGKPFLSPARRFAPGSAWVFAGRLRTRETLLTGPYLDNRAGVWAALQALRRAPDILAVFTVGEEHSGRGGLVAARMMFEEYGIAQAIISDITWHTRHVRCGRGVAVSLRDRFVPRQPFLERVLELAAASGVPFQREIEYAGSSDGGYLEGSPYPIDWVFVGAPEKRPHTPREAVDVRDLQAMVDLSVTLLAEL